MISVQYQKWKLNEYFYINSAPTLFFKRNATFLNPIFPVTLGHRPWPRVMYILSTVVSITIVVDRDLSWCILMLKIQMREALFLKRNATFHAAFLLDKSVFPRWYHLIAIYLYSFNPRSLFHMNKITPFSARSGSLKTPWTLLNMFTRNDIFLNNHRVAENYKKY